MNSEPKTENPATATHTFEDFVGDIGRRRMLMTHARMQERHALLQAHRPYLQTLSMVERMDAHSEILKDHQQRWRAIEGRLQAECEAEGHLPWSPLPGQMEPNFDGSWSTHCARCWASGPGE